jgi:hypothetical protein
MTKQKPKYAILLPLGPYLSFAVESHLSLVGLWWPVQVLLSRRWPIITDSNAYFCLLFTNIDQLRFTDLNLHVLISKSTFSAFSTRLHAFVYMSFLKLGRGIGCATMQIKCSFKINLRYGKTVISLRRYLSYSCLPLNNAVLIKYCITSSFNFWLLDSVPGSISIHNERMTHHFFPSE